MKEQAITVNPEYWMEEKVEDFYKYCEGKTFEQMFEFNFVRADIVRKESDKYHIGPGNFCVLALNNLFHKEEFCLIGTAEDMTRLGTPLFHIVQLVSEKIDAVNIHQFAKMLLWPIFSLDSYPKLGAIHNIFLESICEFGTEKEVPYLESFRISTIRRNFMDKFIMLTDDRQPSLPFPGEEQKSSMVRRIDRAIKICGRR